MTDGQIPEDQSRDGAAADDFQQWGDEVQADQPAADAPATDEAAELARKLAERTEDLQRIQAEYVNYKRRVDRDRALARAGGIEAVATDLLPVLDAIESARANGELTGGFKLVADEIEKLADKYGVHAYGEPGDVFDPHVHEALMAAPSEPGQTEPLCATVLQRGYRVGDRIVRHARVAVSEPDPGAAPVAAEDEEPTQGE